MGVAFVAHCLLNQEFSRRGYGLILVGERDGLAEALSNVGVAVPDRITPSSAAELREFLANQPVPAAAESCRGIACSARSRRDGGP
jgi:hypothetical protein